jgi:hypothetical protein
VADDDVADRARRDVALERFDGAAELGRGLGHGAQPIGWGETRLALALPFAHVGGDVGGEPVGSNRGVVNTHPDLLDHGEVTQTSPGLSPPGGRETGGGRFLGRDK